MEKLSQQKIKDLKKLQLKKYRDTEQLLYVEGETIVRELCKDFSDLVKYVVIQENHLENCKDLHNTIYLASTNELEKLTQLKTSKKVNAVVCYPNPKPWQEGQKALLLDQIQDPGNLGTIIRTADWFGIAHIFCAPSTADYLNPKVIHASMASAFRVNVHYQDLAPLVQKYPEQTFGAFMAGTDFEQVDPKEIQFLILGHEGHGISQALSTHVKHRICIAQKGSAESLNVAVAAGILLQHLSK